ncbi:MAG: alpha/beta hydrolase [Pseudomonadota bacterium]|nr:alpha/beta hydrolase [Pseudomonadota bacterium]
MTTFEEITITLPHMNLAARRSGNPAGPKLLAIHGWLDNAASFEPISPWFDEYDLVAIDLPGHGRSDHRPRGAWYHYIDYLHDVSTCIEALQWQRFSLLGHSLGGAICSVLAAALSERVERLYLIEALGPLSTPHEKTLGLLRAALADRAGVDAKKLRVFPSLDAPAAARRQHPQMPLSAAAAHALVARGTRAVAGGFVWSSDPRLTLTSAIRMTEEQVRNCLEGIQCPAHLVLADPAMPFVDFERMAERTELVSTLTFTRIAGTHHLHMDMPEQVARALRASG